MFSLSAEAANLERWRFDADANRLTFSTDEQIQPRVQLVFNPTRLVIDLPNTRLEQSPIEQTQSQNQRIREIRIGQFDATTTRIVIELEAGYTIDPQAVRVQSSSSTQWTVQFPEPEPVSQAENSQAEDSNPTESSNSTDVELTQVDRAASTVEDLRITPDGLFVQLTGEPNDIDQDNDRRPRQFILDLEDAALSPNVVQRDITVNRHGISRIQLIQEIDNDEPNVRIVLDLDADSPNWQADESEFGGIVLNPTRGRVLSSEQTSSQSLTAAESVPPIPVPDRPIPIPGDDVSTTPIPLPDVSDNRIVVAIDPGHGGRDPGAVGIGGLQEAGIVLDIGLQVTQLLEEQGVRVILTRQTDREIDLEPRVQDANRANADLFVSIHANAISLDRPDVNGIETYYYSDSGAQLARVIHNAVVRLTGSRDRRVRFARFYVLRNTSMPAVLVETGFVTGSEDAARLNDPEFRTRMAEAIAAGILEYVQQNF